MQPSSKERDLKKSFEMWQVHSNLVKYSTGPPKSARNNHEIVKTM